VATDGHGGSPPSPARRRALRAFALALGPGSASVAARAAEVPRRVVLLDADSNVIGVIATPRAMLDLADHLADARPDPSAPADTAWRWRLDVVGAAGTVRWLYAPAGLLRRADAAGAPLLRLADPAGFASLLGVPAR
jgi:hypothetical protein